MKHEAEEITHKVQVGPRRRNKAGKTKYKMKWELKKRRRSIAKKSRSINAKIAKRK